MTGTTENEMVGWHHRLNGREFEWAPGVGDGQGSLVCCSPWGHKESDRTEWMNDNKLESRQQRRICTKSGDSKSAMSLFISTAHMLLTLERNILEVDSQNLRRYADNMLQGPIWGQFWVLDERSREKQKKPVLGGRRMMIHKLFL